jgi:hypothetical protein
MSFPPPSGNLLLKKLQKKRSPVKQGMTTAGKQYG